MRCVASLLVVLAAAVARGELGFVERVQDGIHGVEGLDAIDAVVVSPDERHVYTAAFLDHALAVFARDPVTGRLAFVERVRDGENGVDGLEGVHGVVVSPDGAHVYAAAFYEDEIAIFARDGVTGRLSFRGAIGEGAAGGGDHLHGVFSLALSPDGAWLYAAATYDHTITIFARDPGTGALALAGAVVNGVGGVDGLTGVFQIAVSPDGAHLYAVGGSILEPVDNAVVVFTRDATTGALEFVEATRPPTLDRAHSVEVSPDGRNVYVTSFYTNRVLVHARDATTGKLILVQEVVEGVDGVHGLIGPHATVVTADGTRVHVAGFWIGAIATFGRDPTTGMLTPLRVRQNGACGVRGLGGVRSLALAAAGAHLYAAGEFDDSVAFFEEVAAGGCAAAGPLCLSLRDARAWAAVAAERLQTRTVSASPPVSTRVRGRACSAVTSLVSAVVDGELVAITPHGRAAEFRRAAGGVGSDVGAVITGGGSVRGATWVTTPTIDVSGGDFAVAVCTDAIGDVAGVGAELAARPATLTLGRVVVRAGETRTIDARGAAVVGMDALVLDPAAGVRRDADCRGAADVARVDLVTDPGAQLLVNVAGPVRLGRCHVLVTAPGALVVLHAVGRGDPVTVDDAAVPSPGLVVLAPDRRVDVTGHTPGSSTRLGNVLARKVGLWGSAEVAATCAD